MKGVLVEVMVLFHAINYFLGATHVALKYLDFVTGSFIFISGYLITGKVPKAGSEDVARAKRIAVRGVKLVVLFFCLNIMVNMMLSSNYNKRTFGVGLFFENVMEIFIKGKKYHAIFEILLPIAYLQLMGAIFQRLSWRCRPVMYLSVSIAVGMCVIYSNGITFLYFFLGVGLCGMTAGCVALRERLKSSKNWIIMSISCVFIYFLLITGLKSNFSIYLFGILSLLSLIHYGELVCKKSSRLHAMTISLGQYSLLSYLSQILFLQVLFRLPLLAKDSVGSSLLAILLTNVFLVGLIRAMVEIRKHSPGVNRTYLWIFS